MTERVNDHAGKDWRDETGGRLSGCEPGKVSGPVVGVGVEAHQLLRYHGGRHHADTGKSAGEGERCETEVRRREDCRNHDPGEQNQPADRDGQTSADPVYDTAPWHGEEGWEKREKADQQANLKGTVSVRKRVKTRGNAHNRKGHVKRNGKENDAENHGIT